MFWKFGALLFKRNWGCGGAGMGCAALPLLLGCRASPLVLKSNTLDQIPYAVGTKLSWEIEWLAQGQHNGHSVVRA